VETRVSREDALLERYCDLLKTWAPRLDLVGDRDLGRLRSRHIEDSLRAVWLLRSLPPGPMIDVGSGAGFPGIPLAIAAPERLVRLLEPRAKRAAFLDEVVRALELNCEVLRHSAEQAAQIPGLAGAHVLATARALAPPGRAVELALPLVSPGGMVAVWHGRDAELPEIAEGWTDGIAIVRA
jgi:16S rRNA (guanine527-N7)-methyltransferase